MTTLYLKLIVLQVSLDGYIFLGSPWPKAPPVPPVFPTSVKSTNIISPFWTDLRRGSSSKVWIQIFYKYAPDTGNAWNTSLGVLEDLASNITALSGFQPVAGVVVTWENLLPIDDINGTNQEVYTFMFIAYNFL